MVKGARSMKKRGILNAPLNAAIGELGHYDTSVICDVGLPIPKDMKRIDLSLTAGFPGFMQILTAVVEEIDLERVILAEEIKTDNPAMLQAIQKLLKGIEIEFISHTEFKNRVPAAKFVVRTGEITPFSNIILVSGVQTLFSSWAKSK
jgi:D-ribose pyranase